MGRVLRGSKAGRGNFLCQAEGRKWGKRSGSRRAGATGEEVDRGAQGD
jgi:hypothetical protein